MPLRELDLAPRQSPIRHNVSGIARHEIGLDLATLGVRQPVESDLLGFQVFYGIRASSRHALIRNLAIVPSIGFFRHQESSGNASIKKQFLELGAAVAWTINPLSRTPWHLSLQNHLDYVSTSLSVADTSVAAPSTLRFRMGPELGIDFAIGNDARMHFSTQATFPFESPTRLFLGISSGIRFGI